MPVWQHHLIRHIWAIGAFLAFLTLIGASLTVWDMRRRTIDDARSDLRNLGIVLAEQASRYVQVIDLLMQEAQSHSRDLDIRTPDEFRRRLGNAGTQKLLMEQMQNLPQAHAISLFDVDGLLLNTSRSAPLARFSIADRELFLRTRDHADGEVFVSEPTRARGSGALSIFLGRRITGPDGGFLGVVVGTIDVEYLLDFYQAISRQQRLTVTLYREDGIVLARYPTADAVAGSVPTIPAWRARVAAGGGTYRTPGRSWEHRSIVSVNPLRDYPLVLDLSIDEATVLATWWHQAAYTLGGGVVLAGAFITLFWMIARQMRRQEAQNAALSCTADALRNSEGRLRVFAELASDWFWEQDAELRFTEAGFNSPLRATGDRLHIGKRRWDINDTSRAPDRWEAHRRDVLAHRPFHDFRFERLGPDGLVHHASVSGVPIHDAAGAFIGYRGIGRDITVQIEAERALQQAKERAEHAEALLQDAIDSIAEGFVIYDAEDRLVTCNEGYRRQFPDDTKWLVAGTTFADLLRHGLTDGLYPDAVGREQEWLDAWLRRHREASGPVEEPLSNGKWVLVTNQRMRNGGIAGLRIDITALKQAQAALRDSEARLDRAQEIAGIGSWELDIASGRYIWSRQLYRMRGMPPEFQPTRENIATNIHPDDYPLVSAWLADLRTGHARDPIEIRAVRRDAAPCTLRVEGRAVVDADGTVRRIAGTTQDVTERRMIERQLTQAQKMEAIGNLTGGMAHDFNNVLGVIVGNLELLKRLINADPMASELCEEALDGASRCADLIRRMLAFARRQSLRPERTNINALVNDLARLLDRTLGEDIALELDLDAALWPVTVDPAQLEAALVNLATNARDAMPKGGTLRIATTNARFDASDIPLHDDGGSGDHIVIEISDTGTGIPPEIIGRIFEPFFTTKEPGKGTGLGLSTAFGFVKQSGGHLSVDSEPGRGATFRLFLPRSNSGKPSQVEAADSGAAVGGAETVLVVEDNAQLRHVAARQLAGLGYQVCVAEHAEAALAILSGATQVDLLFTDVVMPGSLDGFDLARQAMQLRRGLKVLLTSGYSAGRGDRQGTAPCPLPLLSKPYRHDQLARAVREVLNSDPAQTTPSMPLADRDTPDDSLIVTAEHM